MYLVNRVDFLSGCGTHCDDLEWNGCDSPNTVHRYPELGSQSLPAAVQCFIQGEYIFVSIWIWFTHRFALLQRIMVTLKACRMGKNFYDPSKAAVIRQFK